MEREIIIFNGENAKEVGEFYGKHAKRIFDENKKKYEKQRKLLKLAIPSPPSLDYEGTTSGSSGHYGWSGTPGNIFDGEYGDFCYTYYVDKKIIPPKMDWKIWKKDWQPPHETTLKYLNISSLFGCFILYEGDSLLVDKTGIHKLPKEYAQMMNKSTMSSGPK